MILQQLENLTHFGGHRCQFDVPSVAPDSFDFADKYPPPRRTDVFHHTEVHNDPETPVVDDPFQCIFQAGSVCGLDGATQRQQSQRILGAGAFFRYDKFFHSLAFGQNLDAILSPKALSTENEYPVCRSPST